MENYALDKNISKNLAVNNFITCLYLSTIVLYLSFTGRLFDISIYQTSLLPLLLASAEVTKYVFFWYNQTKPALKKNEPKKKPRNVLKCISTLSSTFGSYYVVSVLLGAPILSRHFHTMSFASLMTVLTALPSVLYLGPESVFEQLTSFTDFEGDQLSEHFQFSVRVTVIGAWLGAIVIPLDWDRPYQEWPISCYLGAFAGYGIANLLLILWHLYFCNVVPRMGIKIRP